MNITVIGAGRIREKYLSAAIDEYSRRLSRYCRLKITEVADEPTPDGAGEKEENLIRQKEGERILKAIPAGSYVIALAINGKSLSSEEFSEKIDSLGIGGVSHITFLIGGSLGLSEECLRRADYHLSFSKMTFPHQLMRVILLEQIYRAYRIMRNEPYHK